jgi:hypothetical protein
LIGHFVAALDQCVTPLLGKRTVNIDPLPSSLATVTSPPIMRASLREMARPSPVPRSQGIGLSEVLAQV